MQQTEKEQPASVPLSYVLRFFTDAAQKELLEVKKTSSAPVYNSSQNTTPSGNILIELRKRLLDSYRLM